MSGEGLLLLAALRLEARALSWGAPQASVVQTGTGPRRARAAAAGLVDSPVLHASRAVAVAGVCGSLDPDLRPGDVIVADSLLDTGGHLVAEVPTAAILAGALRRAGLTVRVGPIITAERIVRGGAARAAMVARGAVAGRSPLGVDLETGLFTHVAGDRPFAVVRTVADTPARELLSLQTVTGGARALLTLRAVAPVLAEWADTVASRTAVLAGPRSFCAGVERAIQTVERTMERYGTPVFVRRQIVHNSHVVADLEAKGAVFVHELDEVPDGSTVVFSAHGVAPEIHHQADARSLQVIDATCPLVTKVHTELRRYRDRGYRVALVGHAGHDETEGTLGEADDIVLLETPGDVARLTGGDDRPVAFVTQTTLAPSDVADVVGALRQQFPEAVGPHAGDICYATQNRQDAVSAVAADTDLLIVVGSTNSSNSNRLVEVARRAGTRAELVDDETALDLDWFTGVHRVGVTAGASAPETLVQRVLAAVGGLGPIEIETRDIRHETVHFPLPQEVR